ncbi:MAG: hypothetical protein ABUK01_14025 [Leptospirales bacterium]
MTINLPVGSDSDLDEISKLFVEAEKIIKSIEKLDKGLVSPSVNQLRYLAHHLIRILQNNIDIEDKKENIKLAKNHCKRSIYDANEVGILYLLTKISNFQAGYRFISLSKHFNNYPDNLFRINEINKFVEVPLSDGEKIKYYDKVSQHYIELRDLSELFESNRSEINKNYLLKIGVGIFVTIILGAIFIPLLSGYFSKMGESYFRNNSKDTSAKIELKQ